MEDQHFLDEHHLKTKPEKPTFLVVLCIITFVVSGYFLLSTIYGAITFNEEEAMAKIELSIENAELQNAELNSPMLEDIGELTKTMGEESIENYGLLTAISFTSLILSLLGAFLMFNMNKIGFHLYSLSKVIMLTPLFIYSHNWMLMVGYGVIGVIGLAFIIMYATNLKHMKKA